MGLSVPTYRSVKILTNPRWIFTATETQYSIFLSLVLEVRHSPQQHFLKKLNPCFCLRARDQVSHPCKILKYRKFIILPLVLCRCETWCLVLSEEHRLTIFENKLLGGILGSMKYELTGRWRELYNELFHNVCLSTNVLRMIKSRSMWCVGACSTHGEDEKFVKI
jgi:hypothetical protein